MLVTKFCRLVPVVMSLLVAMPVAAQDDDAVSFDQDIRPLLSDRCYSCHGPDSNSREADLRLDLEEPAHESAIVPGSTEDSEFWARIISDDEGDQMPPPHAHKPPFTEAELDLFKRWIEQGAKYERFWAFEKPQPAPVPKDVDAQWQNNPVDAFVASALKESDKHPQPEADFRKLVRRSSLDIIGLPPTPEQIAEQLRLEEEIGREAAWETWIDQLLESPRYGEHMARYWLDLVRFADTNGMHKDFYRNHFAYRDWVIRSFNENLGYDEFLTAQLAGDLLDKPTKDQLTASAFNRLHLIIDVGTALPEESHHKNVVDRVTAVSTAFLGLTMQCAQCHDHKYDPITQKDFYSMYAFFNNFDVKPETPGWPENGLQKPYISLASPEQKSTLEKFDREIQSAQTKINELVAEIAKVDAQTASGAKPVALKAKSKDLKAEKRNREAQLKKLKAKRKRFDRNVPYALVAKEREQLRKTYLLDRGEYDKPSDEVPRDTPGFLPPLNSRTSNPSRLDLAEWLVAEDHPLTSRVAVNRIWQSLMGAGLVRSTEDFGAQGTPPSHPELLDFLADDFRRNGWDTKRLVKLIVTSKTYRQSSVADELAYREDPGNRDLARASRHRLDAEVIRDQLLFVSGEMCDEMYGPSVKPPQPDGLWKSVTMIGERYKADQGDATKRRSIYTYWKRGMPPPQMTILNAPTRDACVARRERTNTPSQALLLLNEQAYFEAAGKFARRVLQKPEDERIAFAWESVTGKLPDENEVAVMEKLLDDLSQTYSSEPELAKQIEAASDDVESNVELAAWTVVANTLFNMDITKNRD
ncbi:PSD1 and planctomycete cytochrome C domain-containing protein [Mariniblastus fucicola]|nr:PSD1 and planctomycete cytochrome C domain-containing protein [Mariniblastus fucicola]